jgi:hypothetical protein
LPERDGVKVLGHARAGDVLDIAWMWPGRITVAGITPAIGVLVRVAWTAPGGVSGVLVSTGEALAGLAQTGELSDAPGCSDEVVFARLTEIGDCMPAVQAEKGAGEGR